MGQQCGSCRALRPACSDGSACCKGILVKGLCE